jgi:hypothetical protein
MKLPVILAASLAFFVSFPINACNLNLRLSNVSPAGTVRLDWDAPPVSGSSAVEYDLFQRRADGPAEFTLYQFVGTVSTEPGRPGSTTVPAAASERQRLEYLLVARSDDDEDFSCTGRVKGTVEPNPLLAAISHRKVVPVVGSARGANGSDFRTSLTIHHFPSTRGRVYFRPVATLPSDADPYVTYAFGGEDEGPYTIHFDDVLAAMGATGMGSLEIIPDQGTRLAVPDVEVRVYNVTSQWTFGSRVPAVWAPDWFRTPETERRITLLVPPVQPNFRRNVGFRALTRVNYVVTMRTANGRSTTVARGEAPANFTWFGTLNELAGTTVPNDARVRVTFDGIAIAFRTETENASNDPTVVVSDPSETERDIYWH